MKDFHLSLNLSNFWSLIAMYFSAIMGWLITAKIFYFDICLGLSICMNSFIILSLIKVAQVVPPK
jgi:hypothetical protein